MELLMIMRVLLRRWYLVLTPLVVAAALVLPDMLGDGPAVSGGYTTTIRYTAAQTLEAIPDRQGDYQDVWLASELTVRAFTEWVRTGRFAEEVAQVAGQSGLQIDAGALSIAADNERSIGQVFISWRDRDELATIAQAVITVLQTRSQAYFPQLGGQAARVNLLDDPRIVSAPPPLTDRFGPLLRLAVALVGGVGLAFLIEYLDPTLRRAEELEALGIRVIGSVPRK
jgi:capsular polysaccharide biosynthesis protein